jgi:hypothetical protein
MPKGMACAGYSGVSTFSGRCKGGHESAIPESRLELMPSLQPNPQTQAHQLNLWSALVLSWARHQRIWAVNTDAKEGDLGEVFWNKGIRRECQRIR